jgi:autotransporter-associated beta strand protein
MSLHRPSRFSSFHSALLLVAIAAIVMAGSPAASAATQTWTGAVNSTFTTAGNWNTGVPGTADTALWDASSTSNLGISLTGSHAVQGLRLTSPSGAVSLGGSTLALGSGGIDMSAATQNLSITSNLTLGGGQSWNVAAGRTLALSTGTFSRAAGTALLLPGSGTVTSSMSGLANVNSIVGPWAMSGAGSATRYTTLSGGALVPFTSGSSVAAFGWPSGNNNTFNYDVAGVQGVLGVGRQANTARYTGTAGTQNWGNNNTTTITLNGLMNVGTGTLTFGEAGGTAQGQLGVGTNNGNELVLAPITSGITITIPIVNGTTAAAGAVTVAGPGTVNITSAGGISTYTGRTTVAAGTLLMSGVGNVNTSSGLNIDGPTARYVHTSSVASTLPVTLTSGTLDGTGSVGAVTVGNGFGGVVTNGNGGTGALTLSSLSFSGVGTATVNSGGSAGLVVTGALSTSGVDGQVTINAAGTFVTGTNNLISYGSFASADINDFTLGTVTGASPRAARSLVLNGNNVALALGASESVVWSGTGTGLWQTGVTGSIGANPNWALATSQTPTDFWTADNTQFNDTVTVSGSTYAPVSLVTIAGGNVSPTTAVFTNSAIDYTISSSDSSGIAGGSVTKNGSGSLTLTTSNSYSAGTTLNAGLLNVNNASAIGSGALTIAGGTLGNSSGAAIALTTNNLQTWSGDVVFAGPADLNMGNGRVTLGGSGTRTVTVSSGTLTVGGLTGTSLSGTLGFTKAGPGTLTLNPTAISGALGSAVGDLTIADGTLNMGAFDLTTTGLTGSGTLANGSNTTRWFFTAVSSGTKTFDGSLQDGAGTGKLGFNVSGGGTQIVNGNGNWSDTTTVTGSTTKLVLNGVNTGTSYTELQNGPTLQFGNTAALAAGARVNLPTAQTATVIYATDGGDNAYAFSGASNSTLNFILDRATAGANVTHPMTSPGVGVAGFGGGTFTANFVRGSNVSGTATAAFDQFNLSGGLGGSTTLNPGVGTVVTIGSVTKALNAAAQTVGLGGATTGNVVTGIISNGVGTISVVKSNSSTWTLSGNSTYTGTTAVLGGTLYVNGDNSAATGAVSVAGGSLGGTGRLGGAITVGTGGTIIPGASIGTLSGTQSVSFTDGSSYGYELNSASVLADLLNVGTDLNLSGTVTLALSDLSSSTPIAQGTVLSLVNYGGAWNGGLLTYSGSALADEDQFTFGVNQFRIDYNSTVQGVNVTSPVGANYVNLVAVPEPTTSVALLSGLGLSVLMLRRRRAS